MQLETVVELQQHEIQDLRDIVKDHLDLDHDNNAVSMKQVDPARQQKADETLRSVMQKHNHQREHRDFKPQALRQKDKEEQQKVHSKHDQQRKQKKQEPQGALLEEDMSEAVRRLIPNPLDWVEDAVDTVTDTANSAANAVAKTAEDVVNGVSDGANLVGDALGDAYDSASDQVAFVANTVIDTVERAVDILVRGFDDWSAGCPDTTWPSLSMDSNGMHVNWGRQKCYVQLMGQRWAQTERDLHRVAPGQRLAPSSRQTSSNTRHGTVFGRPSLRLFGTITTTYAPDGASTSRWSFFFGEKRAVHSLTGWSGRLAEGDGIRCAWCAGCPRDASCHSASG